MPLWDLYCEPCDRIQKDWFVGHAPADEEVPVCTCGQQMKRLIGQFAVVFTGSVTQKKYLNPKCEDYEKTAASDGYFAYRTRNTISGKPEPVRITTVAEERAFAKEQGLVAPSDCGNWEVCSDGKTLSTRGMPGSW
jgi:predicted nucleic acid-binding Zn ribbon protein